MAYEDEHGQEEKQLEAEQADRRRVVRDDEVAKMGQLMSAPAPPEVAEQAPANDMSRLSFLKLGAVVVLALTEGSAIYALDRLTQVKHVKDSVDAYIRAKFRALPKLEQLRANIPSAHNIHRSIRLSDFMKARGVAGPVTIRIGAVGTSNTYALGTMDDHTGPYDQPHSSPQIAAESLTDTGKQAMGINKIEVRTGAIPGADSGIGNIEDPRGLYGVLKQLQDPDFQQWVLNAGEHDLIVVRRETFGLDDLRRLAKTVDEMVSILGDIFRLATSNHIDQDIKRTIDVFGVRLQDIANQFHDNLVAGAAIVAALDAQRRKQGKSGVVLNDIYTWNVGAPEAVGVPFSAIAGGNDDPRIQHVLKPDLVDPNFPNRYYLDLSAIPYGHEIATWAWTLMFQAQNKAVAEISRRYPGLTIVLEDMTEVNTIQGFYDVLLPGQPFWPGGDGHAGVNHKQDISGIQHVAKHDLDLYTQDVHGQGETSAGTYTDFRPLIS